MLASLGPKTWKGIGINLRFCVEHGFFEFLVDLWVPWERFWEAFEHLFAHGCESQNNAGAYTGARFSRFRGVGIGPF